MCSGQTEGIRRPARQTSTFLKAVGGLREKVTIEELSKTES